MINSQPFSSIDQAVVAALPYPVYIVDRKLEVHQANASAVELGLKLEFGNNLPVGVRSQVEDAIVQNRNSLGDDIRRAVHLSPLHSVIPQIYRLAGILSGADGWAILLVDITHLGASVTANAKTLSALSHEVKTPLTGIRMSLHLLLEEKLGALNPNQRELLEVGREECEHMISSVQAQLESARRISGL